MVDTLWPANAVAGAPSYSGRMLRQTGAPAFAGATSARPLGARSGVRPGTPSSTVTATSTTWTCQPFAGVADVMTAAEASAYGFAFDAVATGAVTAAHATLTRKDIIYVSVADPAESIGATPSVTRKYLAGTAGSGVAPSVPGAERGFVIAELNVPISGGGAPTVTWVAPYSAGAGAVIPFNTKAQLDLATTLAVGTYADVFADSTVAQNGLYRWTGTAWGKIGHNGFVRRSVDNGFAAGSFISLGMDLVMAAAPAGTYMIATNILVSNSAAFTGSLRVLAGGTNIMGGDTRFDTAANAVVAAGGAVTGYYTHTGGTLTIVASANISGGSPTVLAGSTIAAHRISG